MEFLRGTTSWLYGLSTEPSLCEWVARTVVLLCRARQLLWSKGVAFRPRSADAARWEPPKSAVTGHPVAPRGRGAVRSESRAKAAAGRGNVGDIP